jgi:raffinose/stachyose/melibiose transport system permease protein
MHKDARTRRGLTAAATAAGTAALMLLAAPAIVIVVVGLKFITQGMTAGGVKE